MGNSKSTEENNEHIKTKKYHKENTLDSKRTPRILKKYVSTKKTSNISSANENQVRETLKKPPYP